MKRMDAEKYINWNSAYILHSRAQMISNGDNIITMVKMAARDSLNRYRMEIYPMTIKRRLKSTEGTRPTVSFIPKYLKETEINLVNGYALLYTVIPGTIGAPIFRMEFALIAWNSSSVQKPYFPRFWIRRPTPKRNMTTNKPINALRPEKSPFDLRAASVSFAFISSIHSFRSKFRGVWFESMRRGEEAKRGRRKTQLMIWSIVYSLMSFACVKMMISAIRPMANSCTPRTTRRVPNNRIGRSANPDPRNTLATSR